MVDNYKINRHKPSLPQTCDLSRNTCSPGPYNRFSRTELTKAKLSLLLTILRNRVSTHNITIPTRYTGLVETIQHNVNLNSRD